MHLGHDISVDTSWDFEIQGIENQASLPLTEEHSDDGGSPSMRVVTLSGGQKSLPYALRTSRKVMRVLANAVITSGPEP